MALQTIFTKKYTEQLRYEAENGILLERYSEEDFPYDEKQCFVIPNMEQPDELVNQMDPNDDIKSAILLYEAYRNLTPLQASDERFWVTLTHRDLFRYVRNRWSEVKNKQLITSSYIVDHWFYKNHVRTSLMGFWWLCYLSVDESRGEDRKYDLTKILLKNQTFATRVFGGTPASRCREVMIGVLEFLEENPILLISGFEQTGRNIAQHLNHLGAVKQLVNLDRNYIKNFLKKVIK